MDSKEQRDEWLMSQLAAGKREGLEPLIHRYAGPILTFIRRMVGDRHRSEELFQEVFLSVWKKRAQYEYPRPFKPWLFAIALNQCRAASRARRFPPSLDLDEDSPAAPMARDPSPVDRAVATETAVIVSAAVAQLPPQQRAVVVLRIWDGLSYAEIAEIVDRSEGTVRSNMHHGLAAVRAYLEPRLREFGAES